jgi:DNA-binding MarR family transcriptional regulator
MAGLGSEGMRALLQVTQDQFKFWGEELTRDKKEEIRPGDMMDYWFILAFLAQQGPPFRYSKKKAFPAIAAVTNLKPSTVERHFPTTEKLGLTETVRSGGDISIQLSEKGQQAISNTLERWVREFGKVQRKYFPPEDPED